MPGPGYLLTPITYSALMCLCQSQEVIPQLVVTERPPGHFCTDQGDKWGQLGDTTALRAEQKGRASLAFLASPSSAAQPLQRGPEQNRQRETLKPTLLPSPAGIRHATHYILTYFICKLFLSSWYGSFTSTLPTSQRHR